VLAVTGSIAVYKTIDLARRLTQAGATVQVVMTRSAAEFVTPLTFQALTYRPVEVEMFAMQDEHAAGMSPWGGRPTSSSGPRDAHSSRASRMLSDDLVATTVLATDAPVIVAPGNGDAHVAQRGTQATSQPYAPAACASSSPRRARSPRATSGRDVSHRSNASPPRSTTRSA